MDRRKFKDVLFYMIMCAIENRESLIDAYDNDDKDENVIDAKKDIKTFMTIRKKLFPNSISKMEEIFNDKNVRKVTISELKKIFEEKI